MSELKKMYEGVANSPSTYLKESLVIESTIIYVADSSVFGELPNLAVIGEDQSAETILILEKREDGGFNVERAVEGTARKWNKTTTIARNFTNYDYEQIRQNIDLLNNNKVDTVDDKGLSTEDYTTEEKELVATIKNKVDKSNVVKTLQEIIDNADEEKMKELIPSGFALKQLFQNVDNGKELIANAIIDKGVTNVSKESTWEELYQGILAIKTGYGVGDVILEENLKEIKYFEYLESLQSNQIKALIASGYDNHSDFDGEYLYITSGERIVKLDAELNLIKEVQGPYYGIKSSKKYLYAYNGPTIYQLDKINLSILKQISKPNQTYQFILTADERIFIVGSPNKVFVLGETLTTINSIDLPTGSEYGFGSGVIINENLMLSGSLPDYKIFILSKDLEILREITHGKSDITNFVFDNSNVYISQDDGYISKFDYNMNIIKSNKVIVGGYISTLRAISDEYLRMSSNYSNEICTLSKELEVINRYDAKVKPFAIHTNNDDLLAVGKLNDLINVESLKYKEEKIKYEVIK